MDVRLNSTDCDEAGDYAVPNVLSFQNWQHGPNCTTHMNIPLHHGSLKPIDGVSPSGGSVSRYRLRMMHFMLTVIMLVY